MWGRLSIARKNAAEVKWVASCRIVELILRKIIGDYFHLIAVAGSIIALDQITKSLVRANLAFQEVWVPVDWLEPYARIVHWKNTGAALGMFQNVDMVNRIISILAVIVSFVILYYYPRIPRQDRVLRFALGLQLGGAVGNLIDRLTQGYVTDFISVGNFPVLNLADASISTGVAILIIEMWIRDRKEKKVIDEPERVKVSEPISEPVSEEPRVE
jgi:signal peptidase II